MQRGQDSHEAAGQTLLKTTMNCVVCGLKKTLCTSPENVQPLLLLLRVKLSFPDKNSLYILLACIFRIIKI